MAIGPEIRCTRKGIAPVPGIWDNYRTSGEVGETISVAVFQWIGTGDENGVKRSNVVKRYRRRPDAFESLCQKAEALCQKLEQRPEVTECDDPRVRINAASAVNTPSETLAALSDDEDARVRLKVARHRNTDSGTLEKLSRDPMPDVRTAVAWNPNTSAQVRAALTKDDIGTVTTAAREAIRQFR
jgi:hypothetical protein